MVPADTSPEVYAIQQQIFDAMSGEQRVLLAFEMSYYTHELAKQCLRDYDPGGQKSGLHGSFCIPCCRPPQNAEILNEFR